jgi:hypothetical protein
MTANLALSVDDLAPASGIVIGVSIGTAIWEVALFVVWHFV